MKVFVFALYLAVSLAVPLGKPRLPLGLNKITGGEEAIAGEFPYQISFQDLSWGESFHVCGGSIFNVDFVITAAHCVYGMDYYYPNDLQIVAGELDLFIHEGHEQVKKVTKIIIHELYSSSLIFNDIALLKLESPLVLNKYVLPIPMQISLARGDCEITGWGTLSEGRSVSSKLHKVFVSIISDDQCRGAYGNQIVDSMICTGGEVGQDFCFGDAGGPLSCQGHLAGVISWGYGCLRPGYPGVYTEVSHFKEWINDHVLENLGKGGRIVK